MPSVPCLRLSDVSVICHATYFHFPVYFSFFNVGCQPGSTAALLLLVYPISHIGRFRKFGSVSCTERASQGNDIELILMVKIETRHPVGLDGSFGSEFPA